MSFKYNHTFTDPFAVVHRSHGTLTAAVSCHKEKPDADTDADARNERAVNMGLSCDYVVLPLSDGVRAEGEKTGKQ